MAGAFVDPDERSGGLFFLGFLSKSKLVNLKDPKPHGERVVWYSAKVKTPLSCQPGKKRKP